MIRGWLRKPQVWLTMIGLGLLGLLLFFMREELGDTARTLRNANIWIVLLLPVIQAVNYFVIAKYYQSMLRLFKVQMSVYRLWGVVAALTFVNQILPSGGMSGLAYLVHGFKNQVSAGVTGLIQLGRYAFSMGSYFILIPVILFLAASGHQSGWMGGITKRLLSSPDALTLAVSFVIISMVFFLILLARERVAKLALFIERLINKASRLFRKRKTSLVKKGALKGAFSDFYEGVDFIKKQKLKITKPLGFVVLNSILEMTIVYTAFQAVGGGVGVGIMLLAFLAANIAGVVSIIPGDVGIHEAVMVIVVSAFGAPAATALSAALLYRVFNKMIYLPLGFWFYTRLLSQPKKA